MDKLGPSSVLDGRFELEAPIGRGGHGSVWRAFDRQQQRRVAIKILRPEVTSPRSIARLAAEAEILRTLEHENVVRAYGFFQSDEIYLVMEHLAGITLKERIFRASAGDQVVELAFTRDVFLEICAAVEAVHAMGILHRDLKPQNIMLVDGTVKVVDFGVAKILDAEPADATTMGRRLGSYMYMSPEQINGVELTVTSDVFSLGVVLFELLTCRRPWALEQGELLRCHRRLADTAAEVMSRILRGERPSACRYRTTLPEAIDDLLRRALAIRPGDRFASVRELREAFAQATPETVDDTAPMPQNDRADSARLPLSSWEEPAPTTVEDATALLVPPGTEHRRQDLMWFLLGTLGGVMGLLGVLWFSVAVNSEVEGVDPPTPVEPIIEAVAAEPRPAATPVPVKAPAPEKKRRPRVRPKKERPARTPPPPVAETPVDSTARLLAQVRAQPKEAALARRLRDAILAESRQIEDPEVRSRIARIAEQSAQLGDVRGLQESFRLLRQHRPAQR